jgi:lipopolysaccharide transport system permease protein
MLTQLRELWKYRELLVIFIQRDLKVRYKNSTLGFAWSLINPLVQVLTISIVLQFAMQVRIESYYAYLFCATLPWLFFSTAIMDSTLCLFYYNNLLRRVYFPRELIPIATIISNLFHFLAATLVFLVYMAFVPVFFWATGQQFVWAIQPTALLLPIPMLGLALLMTGVAMFASVWTLYFEDLRFIVDSALRVLYWLVPVVYFPDMLLRSGNPARSDLLYNAYMLNPLSAYISAFRKLALPPAHSPSMNFSTLPMTGQDWVYLGIAMLFSLSVAVAGHRYFWSRQWGLAERP